MRKRANRLWLGAVGAGLYSCPNFEVRPRCSESCEIMSGVETLLLLPEQRCQNIVPLRLPGCAKRCLFGRHNTSTNTFEDEWAKEMERVRERWGFDVRTETPTAAHERYLYDDAGLAADARAGPDRGRGAERPAPYKQLKITDFLRAKKSARARKAERQHCDQAPLPSE